MWKQKIGISLANNYSIPTTEVIELVSRIGFDAISPVWNDYKSLLEIVNTAKQHGIFIQSLHAPFNKAADMWSKDKKIYTSAYEELFKTLHACREFGIPVMVVHTWIGFDYKFNSNNLYFNNFDVLVEEAKICGVKIAFENTEGEEYFFSLMERYKDNDTVGFCWDSGHEMCYNHSQDLLSNFGDRLIMTHLNDNLGISKFDGGIFWTDDLHLLPYDGIADWDYNVERLRNSKKLEILNFELNINSKPNRHENDVYEKMSLEEYFTEAYKRACKIAYKYSKKEG